MGEPVAQLADVADRDGAVGFRQRLGEHVVAAPAALVRGEFGVAGQVGHERADDRAVPGDAGLHRRGLVVDALHHLELLADDVRGVGVPVASGGDEEGRLARVAVGRLHDQVVAEAGRRRERGERGVAVRPAEHVRDRRRARLVAQLGGDDLGVQPAPQRIRRQDQRVALFPADLLGLFVEEHHRDHRRPAALAQVFADLGVAQQVVVDLLTRGELDVRAVLRGEHPGVLAIPGVVVGDVLEVADPSVDAEQVERRRADEVDRLGVGPEERADLGDAVEVATGSGGAC